MLRHPTLRGREFRVPLPSHVLEAVARLGLSELALDARIFTVGDLLARRIALLSRRFQPNLGIGPERNQFLLAAEAVLEAPTLAAIRRDEQIEPQPVEQLDVLAARLHRTDLRFRKHQTPPYRNDK